jgi:hypothetical protein
MSFTKGIILVAAFISLWNGSALHANSATLFGGVTVNDDIPHQPVALKQMPPAKFDKATQEVQANEAPQARDCICFNQNRVSVQQIDGHYKIVDGDHWILDFAESPENAKLALETIQTYRMNQICFTGRDGGRSMMYFLSNGEAPTGTIKNEDAIPFDSTLVKAEQVNGTWKLTCGQMWMEDFGAGQNAARAAKDAAEQLKYYGFTRQCFVGRPGAPMTYYVK